MSANEISTSIATLAVNTQLTPSPELQKQLDTVKTKAAYVQQLLSDYRSDPDKFMEANDEKSITALTKELEEVLKIKKTIEDDQKDLKNFLKQQTDAIQTTIAETFANNGFDELKKAKDDMQIIKNELQYRRKEKRWAEVEPVFLETLSKYPNIKQYAPELTDFSKFKINNAKLISGAVKQSPAMSTVLKNVRALIADMDAALTLMIENPWGLNGSKQALLLQEFKQNPSTQYVNTNGPIHKQRQHDEEEQARVQKELLERQQAELQLKQEKERQEAKRLEEQRKLAQIQQDALAQQALAEQQRRAEEARAEAEKQAKLLEAQLNEFKQTVVPSSIAAKYPAYIEDLFRRNTNTQLQNNDVAKANELWHLLSNVVQNKQSPAYLSTNGQPSAILEIARFIIDL